jgi:hypothetical protein
LAKIASDGMMIFGGKNLADLDQILDFMLTAYIEECAKIEDNVKDQFYRLPGKEIRTFAQFLSVTAPLKLKPHPADH